ncbi:butyrophilin-like protein 10 [Choloepus didactylus]|uniref:butyrophilin-like protein 10 n=1 Tax=Choloepus didactylus TaxID=27675 RepID=UPI00189EDF25|nr:butyrophilin-like protein 10 [Choloepus didactylus]
MPLLEFLEHSINSFSVTKISLGSLQLDLSWMPWTVMTKMHFQDALLPCCLILVLLQPLLSSKCRYGKADFCIFVPNDTILAIVGKDTELPCHLDPNISVEDMELRWYRAHPSPAVYVYEKGKDMYQEQMKEYQGRTTFLRDGIDKGIAAVRINNVTTFDNGTYHCRFKDGNASTEATLWLTVAGVGEKPRISLRDHKDNGLQAECTSAGWFPEPKVQWMDFRGNSIPSETNISASATSGLFTVASGVTVRDRAVGALSCSIASPLHPERKTARIHLPDSSSSRLPVAAWSIVLPLIPVALGVIAAAICVFWRQQQD